MIHGAGVNRWSPRFESNDDYEYITYEYVRKKK